MGDVVKDDVLANVHSTVFKESDNLEGKCVKIEGYDFNQGVNYSQLLRSMVSTGFQASNLGDAIEVVNQMVSFYFKKIGYFLCGCLVFHVFWG
jgi:deoxyhypusine synthase